MEKEVTITRSRLIEALRQWETDSKVMNWPERSDDERFADNADYLLGLLEPQAAVA